MTGNTGKQQQNMLYIWTTYEQFHDPKPITLCTYRSMKAQFFRPEILIDVHTCSVAHVVVIIHIGRHMILKHMVPRHHQFMCICCEEKEEVWHCSDKRLDFHSFLKL